MAKLLGIQRLANPRRKAAKPKRRKLSDKQIAIFGTKRQKAALARRRKVKRAKPASKSASGKRKRVMARARNPRMAKRRTKRTTSISSKRKSVSRSAKRRTRTRQNPALVVTLGAINPHERKNSNMARKRKKSSTAKRRKVSVRRRSRRPAMVANPRHRYAAPRRRKVRRYSRRRNSSTVYGTSILSTNGLKMIGGGLLGVAGVKLVGRFIPAQFRIGGGLGDAVITGAIAVGLGSLTSRFASPVVGNAVTFGGLMYAGSLLLNSFAPNLRIMDIPLTLNGMGTWAPARFPVPQNPIMAGQMAVAAPANAASPTARVALSGHARGFGNAF